MAAIDNIPLSANHHGQSALKKRSITLAGHKTSLALEVEFWQALEKIAAEQKLSLPALITRIDQQRQGNNLSSAIRVYVLANYHPHK